MIPSDLYRILLSITGILILAKLFGHVAETRRLPAVLGELGAGIVVGNLGFIGIDWLAQASHDAVLGVLAEIGILLMLFTVGLRSNVRDLARVGTSALIVAVLGVVLPLILGAAVASYYLPDADPLVHVFVGATLCATSVGITARVLEDLGRSASLEARVILGAAVIDDVLGLIVLAVVTGAIESSRTGYGIATAALAWTIVKAIAFFVLAAVFGLLLSKRVFRLANRLHGHGLLVVAALAVCFGMSAAAGLLGLAPIVGAFAAGLALDETAYEGVFGGDPAGLEKLIDPIAVFLVPLFFVLMGARVQLAEFARPGVLGFGLALTVVAVAGKQVCALGVREKEINRWAVGLGMVPRGEVGLIFAGIGPTLTFAGRSVVDPGTYTALVLMIFATTLVTPSLLGWALARGDRRSAAS